MDLSFSRRFFHSFQWWFWLEWSAMWLCQRKTAPACSQVVDPTFRKSGAWSPKQTLGSVKPQPPHNPAMSGRSAWPCLNAHYGLRPVLCWPASVFFEVFPPRWLIDVTCFQLLVLLLLLTCLLFLDFCSWSFLKGWHPVWCGLVWLLIVFSLALVHVG